MSFSGSNLTCKEVVSYTHYTLCSLVLNATSFLYCTIWWTIPHSVYPVLFWFCELWLHLHLSLLLFKSKHPRLPNFPFKAATLSIVALIPLPCMISNSLLPSWDADIKALPNIQDTGTLRFCIVTKHQLCLVHNILPGDMAMMTCYWLFWKSLVLRQWFQRNAHDDFKTFFLCCDSAQYCWKKV